MNPNADIYNTIQLSNDLSNEQNVPTLLFDKQETHSKSMYLEQNKTQYESRLNCSIPYLKPKTILKQKYIILFLIKQYYMYNLYKAYDDLNSSCVLIKLTVREPEYIDILKQEEELTNFLKQTYTNDTTFACVKDEFEEDEFFCVVYPFYTLSLSLLLISYHFVGLPLDFIYITCLQILNPLYKLHQQHRYHGNISIHSYSLAETSEYQLVLADLISYSHLHFSFDILSKVDKHAIRYLSPEILFDGICNEKTDIWGFGCILFELLTGKPLFPTNSIYTIFDFLILYFGIPPPSVIATYKNYSQYFTIKNNGQSIQYTYKNHSICPKSKHIRTYIYNIHNNYISEDPLYKEKLDFYISLLDDIFVYDTSKRISAQTLIQRMNSSLQFSHVNERHSEMVADIKQYLNKEFIKSHPISPDSIDYSNYNTFLSPVEDQNRYQQLNQPKLSESQNMSFRKSPILMNQHTTSIQNNNSNHPIISPPQSVLNEINSRKLSKQELLSHFPPSVVNVKRHTRPGSTKSTISYPYRRTNQPNASFSISQDPSNRNTSFSKKEQHYNNNSFSSNHDSKTMDMLQSRLIFHSPPFASLPEDTTSYHSISMSPTSISLSPKCPSCKIFINQNFSINEDNNMISSQLTQCEYNIQSPSEYLQNPSLCIPNTRNIAMHSSPTTSITILNDDYANDSSMNPLYSSVNEYETHFPILPTVTKNSNTLSSPQSQSLFPVNTSFSSHESQHNYNSPLTPMYASPPNVNSNPTLTTSEDCTSSISKHHYTTSAHLLPSTIMESNSPPMDVSFTPSPLLVVDTQLHEVHEIDPNTSIKPITLDEDIMMNDDCISDTYTTPVHQSSLNIQKNYKLSLYQSNND